MADLTGPEVEQVRTLGDVLVVELSEVVDPEILSDAIDAGDLRLTETSTSTDLGVSVARPIDEGRFAGKRLLVTPAAAPAAGAQVELFVGTAALADFFGNTAADDYSLTFAWPSGDAVLADTAAPRVATVDLKGGALRIQLSEVPDLAAAGTTISLDGAATDWALDATGYKLTATEEIANGTHTLEIGGGPLDLSGAGASPLTLDFHVASSLAGCPPGILCAYTGERRLYSTPQPGEVTVSVVGNPFGFHGRPEDGETGLVYMRNRYYDPEIGRFITADPLGYVDGPSLYAFALNSPFDLSDPFGLATADCDDEDDCEFIAAEERRQARAEAEARRLAELRAEIGEHLTSQDIQSERHARDEAAAFLYREKGYTSRRAAEQVSAFYGEGVCQESWCEINRIAGESVPAVGVMETLVVESSLAYATGGLGALALADDIVRVARAADKAEDTVDLYRAVSLAEFEDIFKTGRFRSVPGAYEGKQFAMSLDEALEFADQVPHAVAIVRARVPRSTFNQLEFSSSIDPFIFRKGVATAQPGAQQQLLNQTLVAIEHAF